MSTHGPIVIVSAFRKPVGGLSKGLAYLCIGDGDGEATAIASDTLITFG